MPSLMYLGAQIPLSVQAINGVRISSSWEWAEMPTIEDIPPLQYMGRNGSPITITVQLHPFLGIRPRTAIDAIKAFGDRGKAFPVQLASGLLLGWYGLTSLDEDWKHCLPDGEIYHAQIQLSLRPDRAPETEPLEPPLAVEGSVVGIEFLPIAVDSDRDPSDVPLSEIVRS